MTTSPLSPSNKYIWRQKSGVFHDHVNYVLATDIEKRSQNSYTTPCNCVVSHGLPGVFGFLPTTHAETDANKMRSRSSCAVQRFKRVYLPSSDRSTYTRDKSWLFWLREIPKYLQLEPHAGIKMVQVLGSPVYICGFGSKPCICDQMDIFFFHIFNTFINMFIFYLLQVTSWPHWTPIIWITTMQLCHHVGAL